MKQKKEDAEHTDEDIAVEAQTLRRLASIQKDDESWDDTLTRVLDNAVENAPIENILTVLLCQFEDAVNVNVDMQPLCEKPGMMLISVHTGEVGWEEDITLYEGKEARAVIESQAGEQFCLPFEIIATCDGPKRETIGTTPVYMTDSVLGLEPITLDEGLDQLRMKVGKSNEELRELVYDQ